MRHVNFTLLMTHRCNSNPAEYERNRRFGHLVHVPGRSAGGVKLPSVGLCLNTSKGESRVATATILSGLIFTLQIGGPKSSIDDILPAGMSYLVEQLPLRSIETQPF